MNRRGPRGLPDASAAVANREPHEVVDVGSGSAVGLGMIVVASGPMVMVTSASWAP